MRQKYTIVRDMLYGIAKPQLELGSAKEVQGVCNDISQLLELYQQRFDNRSDRWKKSRCGRCHARFLYVLFSRLSDIERDISGDQRS